MRNSDKCIITAIISFLIGALFLGLLYFDDNNYFYAAIFPSILFLYAGYKYGMARGWHDIELRRTNPDYFEDERLEDD